MLASLSGFGTMCEHRGGYMLKSVAEEVQGIEHQEWVELGMSRLEPEWDNPEDAVYDDWKKLYSV